MIEKDFHDYIERPLFLPEQDSWPASRHQFDRQSVAAIQAAIYSGRPLLLRGEPGIGKSQLARAAAKVLEVPFLCHVVDERSERDDLLYSYDAISRLAEAQVSALTARENEDWRARLSECNFFRPGVLWWAFNWDDANTQTDTYETHCRGLQRPSKPDGWIQKAERHCGPVVLVDEIDKADPSVPNGLLESLGNEGFQTSQMEKPVRVPKEGKPPLVMITTNEERELPAAFLRRCLVLKMRFPEDKSNATEFLFERARVHFSRDKVSDAICMQIAERLLQDRAKAQREGLARPGAAEFLDLVRILSELCPGKDKAQEQALNEVGVFALSKNMDDVL